MMQKETREPIRDPKIHFVYELSSSVENEMHRWRESELGPRARICCWGQGRYDNMPSKQVHES